MQSQSDVVSTYLQHYRTKDDALFWAWDFVNRLVLGPNPVEAWELVLRLIRAACNDAERSYIAAGPVEDLLRRHGSAIWTRVEGAARADDGVRKTLMGVWGGEGMDPKVWFEMQTLLEGDGAH